MFNKSKIQMFIFLDEFLVTFILTLKDHRAQKMLSSPLKWLRVGRTCAPFLKNRKSKLQRQQSLLHPSLHVYCNN